MRPKASRTFTEINKETLKLLEELNKCRLSSFHSLNSIQNPTENLQPHILSNISAPSFCSIESPRNYQDEQFSPPTLKEHEHFLLADEREIRPRIGIYSRDVRSQKIAKYKKKQAKYRAKHPVERRFPGRAKIANQKMRVKGKFVKREAHNEEEIISNSKFSRKIPTRSTADISIGNIQDSRESISGNDLTMTDSTKKRKRCSLISNTMGTKEKLLEVEESEEEKDSL